MSCLFRSHPFLGLQCTACMTRLDAESESGTGKAVRDHLRRSEYCRNVRGTAYDGLLADGETGKLARRDALALPLSHLQTWAKFQVKLEGSEPGRLTVYYCSFLKEVTWSKCNICGEVVTPKNERLHRSRKDGCTEATFSPVRRLIPHYECPDRNRSLPLDFDVSDEEIFSKIFRSHILRARRDKMRNEIEFEIEAGAPDPIEEAARTLLPVMEYEPREVGDSSYRFPTPPKSKLPESSEESNLRLLNCEQKEKMLVAELEKYIGDGSNTPLLHFIQKIGLWAYCRDFYDGNFKEMAKSLTKYLAPVDSGNAYECAVDSAAKLTFEVAHNQLDAANPLARSRIMGIGNYDGAVLQNRANSLVAELAHRYSVMTSAEAVGDDDDGEGPLGYTSITDFARGEAHLIVELAEAHGNSNRVTGFDKPMDRLSPSSLDKYCTTFRKLVLFAFRILHEQGDEELAQYNDVLSMVSQGLNSQHAKCRAIQFVRRLFLRILELDDNSSMSSLVENPTSIMSIFVRAMALDSTGLENQEGVLRVNSPGKVHAAGSHLLYAIRALFLLELVNAVKDGDSERLKALGGPERLTKSPTMMDLAVVCAIAKASEKKMDTGT